MNAFDLSRLRPRLPSPLEPVEDERFTRRGLTLLLKREDLIHPDLPGNKWRKLALNLRAADGRPVLTFGGAYSNHLRATAAAGRLLGFPTTGIVRGDELAGRPLNPSLARCAADGMRLEFVDRATYRAKNDPGTLAALLAGAPADTYVVPEGGSNTLAVHGCVELGRELAGAADVVAVACGTGGTLAGLAAGLSPGSAQWASRSSRAASWARRSVPSRRRRSAARAASGPSTSASTAAVTPVRARFWRRSHRTSRRGTDSPSSGCMSPKCCTGS